MKLLIVAGMLGVGKTSVIMKLVDNIMKKSDLKIVIIENDIGEVGIDSEILEKHGLKVKELKGGCICCTLKSSLVDTLRELQIALHPDVVIVEPTGVADPMHVISSVDDVTGLSVSSIFSIIVMDAERFEIMRKAFQRPIRNQIKIANLVLINKMDTVSEETLLEIESFVRHLGYEGNVIRVRGDTGYNMESIPEMIF